MNQPAAARSHHGRLSRVVRVDVSPVRRVLLPSGFASRSLIEDPPRVFSPIFARDTEVKQYNGCLLRPKLSRDRGCAEGGIIVDLFIWRGRSLARSVRRPFRSRPISFPGLFLSRTLLSSVRRRRYASRAVTTPTAFYHKPVQCGLSPASVPVVSSL